MPETSHFFIYHKRKILHEIVRGKQNMVAVTFILTLGLLMYPGSYGNKETDICKHTLSCSECIKSHPSCVWCSAKNFTQGGESEGSRCATRLELLQRGCDEEQLMDPKGLVQFLKDVPLSDNADEETVTQLAPQKVYLKLRPGEKRTFQVRFKRAEGYPIDLYYLMDLSYSMKDDLENVKKLGSDIQEVLHNVTKSVRIGFGSFVDKTVLPFVNTMKWHMQNPCPSRTESCQPPFSYRHVLSLTSNLTLFQQRVSAENISGNLDTPEGGFDAILQAAVCTDHIGWRNVTRLLVFASDDVFHIAGDGKLGGIYIPTDGRCHLNENGEYYNSNMFDYPSVGHLSQILTSANIQPIFAVTSNVLPTYQGLSELIPKSAVGELKEDSSNVVNLISQAYNNLSSTVNLEHVNLPKGIHISYDSHCPDSTKQGQPHGLCSGVKINQMVDFNVTLWMDEKTCQDGLQSFKLRVLGFNEEITVDVKPVCHCDCKDEEAFSSYCTGGYGNYSCGICSCVDGYKGKHCECHQNRYDSDKGCINGSLTCNGRGKCECGRCACNKHVRGQFCECDDASCERYEGQLCGGLSRGVCNCGTCKCTSNYTGSACGCSLDISACMTPNGICSGHGKCQCSKCVCDKGYFNKLCSDCPGCQTPCQKYSACAECKAFTTGLLKENCTLHCGHVKVTMLKASEWSGKEKDIWCQEKGEDSLITFHVTEDGDLVHILVKEKQEIQDHRQKLILGLVLGIVCFGLLIIIVYRVTVEVYDRQEYRRFMKARSQEQWNDAQNPLYKSATTTVVNPNFLQE